MRDHFLRSGDVHLRSSPRRRLLFSVPLLALSAISLATTWQSPRALLMLLLFGVAVGGPFVLWSVGHRVEVTDSHVRHGMPLAPLRTMRLSDVAFVDLRPSDRRWPFRAYVVTLATQDGTYLPFETANFEPADVLAFLDALMPRLPKATYTDRATEHLQAGL